MTKTIHAIICGRVQGVAYRYWTQNEAIKKSLLGWVRNRRDGCVEAVFSGPEEDVADMLAACWSGPMMAKVTDIKTEVFEGKVPQLFEILPTCEEFSV